MHTTSDRTDAQIIARLEEVKPNDWMGTQQADLIAALSVEAALPYLTEEAQEKYRADPESWTAENETALEAARGYMDFAVGKATGHRGLSASRSVDHFRSWLWLMGDEAFDAVDWDDYENYGAPILKQVAGQIDAPVPNDEEFRRMSEGLPCTPDCQDGCGS